MINVIPLALRAGDRAAGFDWELSMLQIEFSKTPLWGAPRRACAFFDYGLRVLGLDGIPRPPECLRTMKSTTIPPRVMP